MDVVLRKFLSAKACVIETSRSIFIPNQLTGFSVKEIYTKRNVGTDPTFNQ